MNDFLTKRLVCPISKVPLLLNDNLLSTPSGLTYCDNDFRVGLEFSRDWSTGQAEYEFLEKRWLDTVNNPQKLLDLDAETSDIYNQIQIHGDVLDVGGAYGFVIKQANLDPSRYVSIDPINMDWKRLEEYEHVSAHYSICKSAVRIRGFAEFLPFTDSSFDFVHMCSCIDHFANPKLALTEAFRVLRLNGRLVIGISLEGSYKKKKAGIKGFIKRLASRFQWLQYIIKVFRPDHHMFHPTKQSLEKLVVQNGFVIEKEVWQQAYHNVIYIQAVRSEKLKLT